VKFLHLSDLHFSSLTHDDINDRVHCNKLLADIERIASEEEPDFVLVTGDVSNWGDSQSIMNARNWLFDKIPIGGENELGLQLPTDRVIIVPGNHDAYGSPSGWKRTFSFWQKSLKRYNREFPINDYLTVDPNEEYGCSYQWLEGDGFDLYICLINSSYLRSDRDPWHSFFTLDRVAAGKVLRDQSRTILNWHSMGLRGDLPKSRNGTDSIPSSKFRRAKKIALMHHYVFPPKEGKKILDYSLRLKNRKQFIHTLLTADFNFLLCGHKHIISTVSMSYDSQMDRRSRGRYLLNMFKQSAGLTANPPHLTGNLGSRFARSLVTATIAIWKWASRNNQQLPIAEVLRTHLGDSESFGRALDAALLESETDHGKIDALEMDEIKNALQAMGNFERKALAKKATKFLTKHTRVLADKRLIQIMSGSSSKRVGDGPPRGVNLYEFNSTENRIQVSIRPYRWDPMSVGPLAEAARFQSEETTIYEI